MQSNSFPSLNLLLDNVEGTNLLLEYLCGFSGRLHTAKDFESILDILNEELRKIYARQKIEVVLRQKNQQSVKFEFADRKYKVKPCEEIINQGTLYSYILEKHQTILTNSYRSFCDNLNLGYADLPAQSWLGIPMIVRGKVLGGLIIWDDNPEHYLRLQDKQFLSTITDMITVALENIYLYDYLSEGNGALKIFESIQPDEITTSAPKNIIAQLLRTVSKQANIVYTGLFVRTAKHKRWKLIDEKYDDGSFKDAGIELIKHLPQLPESIFQQKDHILWVENSSHQQIDKTLQEAFSRFPVYSMLIFPFDNPGIYSGCWVVASSTKLRETNEKVHLFQFIFNIINQLLEKKALHDIAGEHQNYIQHLEKMKAAGELASSTAHHLNNIFSVILNKAQKLKDRHYEASIARDIELLLRAASDGANSVQRLQKNVSQNQLQLEQKPVAINEIIREVVEIVRPRYKEDAKQKGIQYELELNLGNAEPVIGDSMTLREVIFNLISNALDAMPKGGKLLIQTTQQDGKVIIFVSDTGIGIPEKIQQKIFEPFFTTKGEKGNGLGLSIASDIIKQHGGRIYVDSILNRGTIFMVELPLIQNEVSSKENSKQFPINLDYKILLVDDEGIVRETFAELLKESGCEVTIASNAQEALAKFQKFDCDIIFTDLNMPGTDGIALAREFKKIDKRIPVFIITGWNFTQSDMKDLNDIIAGVIRKPFNMQRIMDEIQRVASQ